MSDFQPTSEATDPPLEWDVLSPDEREFYYLAWGNLDTAEFLAALEAKFPGYADEYAEPEHVKHGFWCVDGDLEAEDATAKICAEGDLDARAATWVFINDWGDAGE